MRLIFSILVIVFSVSRSVSAQSVAVPQLKLKTFGSGLSPQPVSISTFSFLKTDTAAVRRLVNQLPLDYYSQHLGVACKMELQMEKQMKLPIRIRLGSKEQVDYLEGKFSRNR